jgi:hypothetical protein
MSYVCEASCIRNAVRSPAAAVQPSRKAAAPMSEHDAREQEFFVQMALETITGTKPMTGVNLSDDWWRNHGK